jgi:hypothetical protein
MAVGSLKKLLPDRAIPTRVIHGPFRGAVMVANRRHSLRKIFGLYEHELNAWLDSAIPLVRRVLDVGANDGYFTFGCAAAFRRRGLSGEIIAFEPQANHVRALEQGIGIQPGGLVEIRLHQCLVGDRITPEMTTLDAISWRLGESGSRENTLIKIDVEGAELEVLKGARSWLVASNLFIIEVHEAAFLPRIIDLFTQYGLRLERIDQRPLPILGPEERKEENWWLVSGSSGRS